MKKLFVLLVFNALLLSAAFAQHSYLTVKGGYGFSSSQRTLATQVTTNHTAGTTSYEAVRGSYGAGLRMGVGFQRMTKKNWGWGIELDYLFGKAIKVTNSERWSNGAAIDEEVKMKSNALFVIPSISKQFDTFDDIVPHVELGIILGAPKTITEFSRREDPVNSGLQTNDNKRETTHRFAIGSRLSGGVDFVSEKSIFFIDVEFNILSPWKKETVLVKSTVNGKDQNLGPVESRTTKYEKEFKEGESNTVLADTSPFGSLGLRMGLKFFLRR